jgi:hypothetical protein
MSDGIIFRKATAQELIDAARRTKTDAYAAPLQVHRTPRNTPLIEFEITACDDPYEEATATVLRMPCGFRIPGIEGCSVEVHDTAGCWLEGPPDPESEDPSPSIGQIGYAVLMQQTSGETGTDECTLDDQDECKWVIISLCKDATEITVRNIEPCEDDFESYSEVVNQITFGYGLDASDDDGEVRVDLGVTLLGQDQVPLPCGCGDARFSWDGTQWNLISGCDGPRCSAPDPPAPPESACGTAVFEWTGSAWKYISGCTGATCAVPPPPTGTGSFVGDTEAVPCDVADVFLPCTGGGVNQTEVTQYNEIEFLGNLRLNPDLSNPCRAVVRGETIFAVHGADATEDCNPDCGEALFVWVTTPSPGWELVTPCGGLRCETPEPPSPPEDQTTPGQTISVPCGSLPEDIRQVCINTTALEFSEKFSVQLVDNKTYIDIDLCRLFADDEFQNLLCDAVEDCVGDIFDNLCEELEECIKEKVDERLQELCNSTNVLIPIDENTAATVDAAETRIEFACQTIHFVTCPDKESEPTESCGPRYIEGTDCPEDEPEEVSVKAGCSKDAMAMLLEKVQQLEARIAELEAR